MSSLQTFTGTPSQCGALYAKNYQPAIAGFFSQEFGSYSYSTRFVRACLKRMEAEAPLATAFIRGLVNYSLLSLEEHVLLLLHEEELYHRKLMGKQPHCSVAGVAHTAAHPHGVVVGMNWDWNTAYYPWASFNRFYIKGYPQCIALSFPGLPMCAGLNAAGLTLMWTGAGYYPPVGPRVGVPTYALLIELLLKKDVPTALNYLRSVRNAGAFIFFLGDRLGNLAAVEGVPGKLVTEFREWGYRANVYETAEAIEASGQTLPPERSCHSKKRNKIFAQTFPHLVKKPTVAGVKSMLSQPDILIEKSFSHATVVQLIADCGSGVLHTKTWRQASPHWAMHKFKTD